MTPLFAKHIEQLRVSLGLSLHLRMMKDESAFFSNPLRLPVNGEAIYPQRIEHVGTEIMLGQRIHSFGNKSLTPEFLPNPISDFCFPGSDFCNMNINSRHQSAASYHLSGGFQLQSKDVGSGKIVGYYLPAHLHRLMRRPPGSITYVRIGGMAKQCLGIALTPRTQQKSGGLYGLRFFFHTLASCFMSIQI